jgi:ATP-dependent Lon protease
MSGDRQIFLAAQRDVRDDNPSRSRYMIVGVVANIKQVFKSSRNAIPYEYW